VIEGSATAPLSAEEKKTVLKHALKVAISTLRRVKPEQMELPLIAEWTKKTIRDALYHGIEQLHSAYELVQESGNQPSLPLANKPDLVRFGDRVPVVIALIDSLLHNAPFARIVRQTKIRASSASFYESNTTVEQILRRAIRTIEDSEIGLPVSGPGDHVSELRRVVPHQQISPIQFGIRNEKLVIVNQTAFPDAGDEVNVASSKNALLASGGKLVAELRKSNCDPRLLQSVAELEAQLACDENIVCLGLMNIGVEEMGKAFEAELPDALRGMLLGHTRGVAMYVAQFPEWQRFSEKAASAEFTENDIERISVTAKSLVDNLEQHPEIADDEVPKTIKALQQLITNPKLTTKRAAFAVLRTIENLVAKVFEYCTDFLDKSARKTIEGLSTATSRVIIVTMMTVALGGALGISPLGAKFPDTSWVKTAAEIVQNEIESLSK
jgi:histone H3/H4